MEINYTPKRALSDARLNKKSITWSKITNENEEKVEIVRRKKNYLSAKQQKRFNLKSINTYSCILMLFVGGGTISDANIVFALCTVSSIKHKKKVEIIIEYLVFFFLIFFFCSTE